MSYKMSARVALIGGGGEASLRVEGIDTVHGHPTYRLALQMTGRWTWANLNTFDRSWLDVNHLFARRFHQLHRSTGDNRDRTYEFFPEEMRYVNPANADDAGDLATAQPLDDISFIYHVRTLPLSGPTDYLESRYYKAEGNPVTVQVLRTERVRVPAGDFEAIVVRPIIRTNGLFREGGQAEIWLSNDERRVLLKLKAKVKLGSLTMELRSYEAGTPAARVLAPPSSAPPF
jgi:hypothetical protein